MTTLSNVKCSIYFSLKIWQFYYFVPCFYAKIYSKRDKKHIIKRMKEKIHHSSIDFYGGSGGEQVTSAPLD